MRPIRLAAFACAFLLASTASVLHVAPGAAARERQTEPFSSVELRNGGELLIRHSTRRSVILSSAQSRARVVDGRLVVEICPKHCAHGERTPVTVLTPALEAVAVSNGGILRIEGAFPRQPSLAASVEQGGTIDIRAMQAENVAASIFHGGRIFTRPARSLTASVRSGGIVAYWGDPAVQRAIAGGGVVERGSPEDEARPLAEFDPPLPRPPRLPHLPDRGRDR